MPWGVGLKKVLDGRCGFLVEKQIRGWNWKRVNGGECHGYESVESNYWGMRQIKYNIGR